jgi:hypothetical protein
MASRMLPSDPPPPNCVIIPSETAGPFPLDLTENQTFFRQDIRENRIGVRHDLKLKIIGNANCEPCRMFASISGIVIRMEIIPGMQVKPA